MKDIEALHKIERLISINDDLHESGHFYSSFLEHVKSKRKPTKADLKRIVQYVINSKVRLQEIKEFDTISDELADARLPRPYRTYLKVCILHYVLVREEFTSAYEGLKALIPEDYIY